MNIPLSAGLEAFIRQKVDSGQYNSPSQVVEEGLLLLEERDQVMGLRRERLLRELADAVAQANNHQVIAAAEVYKGLANKTSPYGE